ELAIDVLLQVLQLLLLVGRQLEPIHDGRRQQLARLRGRTETPTETAEATAETARTTRTKTTRAARAAEAEATAGEAFHAQLERRTREVLESRLLVVLEDLDDVIHRLLLHFLPLLQELGEAARAGQRIARVLLQGVVDCLDLVLLVVAELQGFLHVLLGEQADARLLVLDLLQPLDLFRL